MRPVSLLVSSSLFSLGILTQAAETSTPNSSGGITGPSSVQGQLDEDEAGPSKSRRLGFLDGTLQPWTTFKSNLRERSGLTIGADYTSLLMWTTSGSGEDEGFGGIARLYGTWELTDREGPYAGSLVFKGENRHRLGSDIAPQNLGFASGYNGIPGTAFSDFDWGITNFYWRQKFGDCFSLLIGQVDVTDYLDIYGLVNPWSQFQNLAFLTNPTIPAPNQGLGAALGARLSDRFYVVGGIADANGDPTISPFTTIEEGEFFKHLEFGWYSSYDRRYFDNVHLTAWHADRREAAGVPESWGVAFSATKFIDDRWMPFLRAGYADGDAPLLSHSVSVGIGRYFDDTKDLAGLGVNWGRPSDSALDDQWTAELFFRYQLAQSLAITPSVQLISDPALDPSEDLIAYFGLRARMTF